MKGELKVAENILALSSLLGESHEGRIERQFLRLVDLLELQNLMKGELKDPPSRSRGKPFKWNLMKGELKASR